MTSSDVIEPLVYRLELLISQAEKAGSNEDWTSVLLVFKEALATAEPLNCTPRPDLPQSCEKR